MDVGAGVFMVAEYKPTDEPGLGKPEMLLKTHKPENRDIH